MGGGMMKKHRNFGKMILETLEREAYGLSISEVAVKVGTTRITARKHLERLNRAGVLEEVRKGRMRIFWLREGKINE